MICLNIDKPVGVFPVHIQKQELAQMRANTMWGFSLVLAQFPPIWKTTGK